MSMEERKIATREDWDILPMPEENTVFIFERHFTDEQMNSLRQGFVPREMEDKWFWFMEGNTLYAHRSWTGICIYAVEFNQETDQHRVTVNRNIEQYRCDSIEADADRLNMLLNFWSRPFYDSYGEFIVETAEALKKGKK